MKDKNKSKGTNTNTRRYCVFHIAIVLVSVLESNVTAVMALELRPVLFWISLRSYREENISNYGIRVSECEPMHS